MAEDQRVERTDKLKGREKNRTQFAQFSTYPARSKGTILSMPRLTKAYYVFQITGNHFRSFFIQALITNTCSSLKKSIAVGLVVLSSSEVFPPDARSDRRLTAFPSQKRRHHGVLSQQLMSLLSWYMAGFFKINVFLFFLVQRMVYQVSSHRLTYSLHIPSLIYTSAGVGLRWEYFHVYVFF